MEFTKMQGAGNDFIFLLDLDLRYFGLESKIAKNMCDRHFGVGADGLVLVRKSNIADIKMVIINSDGSLANMCGNATRCFGKYVYEKGIVEKELITLETGDGIKELSLKVKDNKVYEVKVCMGEGSFEGDKIPLNNKKDLINEEIVINGDIIKMTSVLVGVPHTVIIDSMYDVIKGKEIEKFELFSEGTNVNFVTIKDRENINVDTWERGAGATLACGTGCSASVLITNKLGLTSNRVNVKVPGGNLIIEINDGKIYMIGNSEFICEGIMYQ